jgi:hypothetical protein
MLHLDATRSVEAQVAEVELALDRGSVGLSGVEGFRTAGVQQVAPLPLSRQLGLGSERGATGNAPLDDDQRLVGADHLAAIRAPETLVATHRRLVLGLVIARTVAS